MQSSRKIPAKKSRNLVCDVCQAETKTAEMTPLSVVDRANAPTVQFV
jgi:hypothetical protein